MSEDSLYKNMMLLGSGMEACVEKRLYAPALILIYSAIDTVGWLDSCDEFSSTTSFVNWVDAYLLKAKALRCTSLELYAARCGLLHTFTADSKLSSQRMARRIVYAWGRASTGDLQRTIDVISKSQEYVAVHANDLHEAWRLGVGQFVEDLEKDLSRKTRVYRKANRFFTEIGLERMSDIMNAVNDKESA